MDLQLVLLSSFFVFLFFNVPVSESMPTKSQVQYLPPLPGYIPVYIQDGDSPPNVAQSPASDKMDTDVEEVPPSRVDDPDSILRESKDFIVQQLLRGTPREEEVRELQELAKTS